MLSSEKKNDIGIVTSMRGLASLMVFLFHLFCVTNNYFGSPYLTKLFYYGKFGVEIFFVISGYVIVYSMIAGQYHLRHFKIFFLKRIIRIEPPYLAAILLIILGIWIKRAFLIGEPIALPSIQQILYHIGYLIPFTHYDWLNIVFWTLAIEFQFYVIFSLILRLFTGVLLIRTIAASALLLLAVFVSSEAIFFHHVPIFLLGIYLALYKHKIVSRKELISSAVALTIFIYLKLGWEISIFSCSSFLLIYHEPILRNNTLKFLGNISYSLYLCHTIVAFTIVNIAFKLPQTLPIRIGVFLISFTATIVFSYIFYRFIELPAKIKASSFKYK
ncbi:MAG: acyltransferase [Chitinophagaceae bacterium]